MNIKAWEESTRGLDEEVEVEKRYKDWVWRIPSSQKELYEKNALESKKRLNKDQRERERAPKRNANNSESFIFN